MKLQPSFKTVTLGVVLGVGLFALTGAKKSKSPSLNRATSRARRLTSASSARMSNGQSISTRRRSA